MAPIFDEGDQGSAGNFYDQMTDARSGGDEWRVEDQADFPRLQPKDAKPNPYAGLTQRTEGVRAARLRAYDRSVTRDPDSWAERMALATRQQVPTGVADRNYDELAQRDREQVYADMVQRSKKLAEWLEENPDNVALSRDDYESLVRLERALRTPEELSVHERKAEEGFIPWALSAAPAAFSTGQAQVQLSRLRFKQLQTGVLSPEEMAKADELSRQLGEQEDLGTQGWWTETVTSVANQLPIYGMMLRQGAEYGMTGAIAAGGTAAVLGQLGPQAATPEELITVPAAAMIGGSVAFTAGSTLAAYELETGLAYDEYLQFKDENGDLMDPRVAGGFAAAAGFLNAGLEFAGLRALLRTVPGGDRLIAGGTRDLIRRAATIPTVRAAVMKAMGRYAEGVATEAATEFGQEMVTTILGELAKVSAEGEFESIGMDEAMARSAEAAKAAFQASSVLMMPGSAMTMGVETNKALKARENIRIIEALGDGAKASKLRERMPEKFREAVAKMTENGPIKNAYVDVDQWDSLFQSIDPENGEKQARVMAAEVFGDGGKAYDEAKRRGGDLEIPLSRYAEKLAGTDLHGQLMQDVRFDVDAMSAREAEDFFGSWQARSEELRAEAEAEAQSPSVTAFYAIRDDVAGQLMATGMDQATAEANAALRASGLVAMAEREGMDPMQLAEARPMRVTRPMPDILKTPGGSFDATIDPMLDRLRAGDMPRQQDAFGETITEFLRRQGGIRDEGGELSAMDADSARQPFQRNLASEQGVGLDEAAGLAAEAGFLPGMDYQTATPNDLLEAIRADLAGEPVFSAQQGDTGAQADLAGLEELASYLDELGLDPATMDNETIKAALIDQQGGEAAPNDVLYSQFVGELAKNADKRKLRRAFDMLEEGTDGETVRRETGWFVGEDGYWRYEISDDKARITPGGFRKFKDTGVFEAKLGEILDHPDLYAAYPDLATLDVSTTFVQGWSSYSKTLGLEMISLNSTINSVVHEYKRGKFRKALEDMLEHLQTADFEADAQRTYDYAVESEGQDGIALMDKHFGSVEQLARTKRENAAKAIEKIKAELEGDPGRKEVERAVIDTLLHEVQHAIQRREGHARGGMPELFTESLAASKDMAERMIRQLNDEMHENVRERDALDRHDPEQANRIAELEERYQSLLRQRQGFVRDASIDVRDEALERYRRLAGEVEARNVETRRQMTPEARAKTGPDVTADRPKDKWIIRMGDRDIVSASIPANAPLEETIEVDGVERPTTNSEGLPIHDNPQKVEAFWRWFGNSQMVDDQGRPRVFYHATRANFDEFRAGDRINSVDGVGVWFDGSPEGYGLFDGAASGSNVMPVYLRVESPMEFSTKEHSGIEPSKNYADEVSAEYERLRTLRDAMVERGRDNYDLDELKALNEATRMAREEMDRADDDVRVAMAKDAYSGFQKVANSAAERSGDPVAVAYRDKLRKQGRDGVILQGTHADTNTPREWVLVLDPDQIKSAIGNRGTFDANEANVLFQSVYHGTPHTFDRFSLEAIGTGEGAQAYGWGLYFAGKREIAEYYRDALVPTPEMFIDGERVDSIEGFVQFAPDGAPRMSVVFARGSLLDAGGDFGVARDTLLRRRAEAGEIPYPEQATIKQGIYDQSIATLDALEQSGRKVEVIRNEGNLIEANIPDDELLLDWDAPLAEQNPGVLARLAVLGIKPPKPKPAPKAIRDPVLRGIVRDALKQDGPENLALMIDNDYDLYSRAMSYAEKRGEDLDAVVEDLGGIGAYIESMVGDYLDSLKQERDMTGAQAYYKLEKEKGSDRAASQALNDAGIPGLRYLDGMSRSDGEGSHNYVIWDEEAVTVEAVNGQKSQAIELFQSVYQGEHKPMSADRGAATLDDLTPAFGEDIYTDNALQFFGSGDAREAKILRILESVRGNPDAEITIYRGVPAEADGINPGDWVTLLPEVAEDYAAQSDGGRVESMKVRAGDVTGWADSLMEYGYFPEGSTFYQSVYHGSPYKFDKFSLEAIGTGEGAQAYGWGLYLAGRRGVAEFYRHTLSMKQGLGLPNARPLYEMPTAKERKVVQAANQEFREVMKAKGIKPDPRAVGWSDYYEFYNFTNLVPEFDARYYEENKQAIDAEIERLQDKWLNDPEWRKGREEMQGFADESMPSFDWLKRPYESAYKAAVEAAQRVEPGLRGNLYQADIPDDGQLLDFDATLSEQPAVVQAALAGFVEQRREEMQARSNIYTRPVDEIVETQSGGAWYDDLTNEAQRQIQNEAGPMWEMIATDPNRLNVRPDQLASRYLGALGVPGLRYRDAFSRDGTDTPTFNYVIWDEGAVSIEAVNDQKWQADQYFQGDNRDDKRGAIKVPPRGDYREFRVELFDRANLSTFLHETGHYFLEVMADLAERPEASEGLRNDWQTVLDYLGVEGRDQIGVDQHEYWARSFEAYLHEGKAPSAALRRAFAKFQAWLSWVYKTLLQHDVELTDEVRGVMDRMLAGQDAVKSAAGNQSAFRSMFDAAAMENMNADERAAYLDQIQAAKEEAEEQIANEVVRELSRENTKQWKAERERVRAEVEAEVDSQPGYTALRVMQKGIEGGDPIKLSRQALVEQYGEPILKRLPGPQNPDHKSVYLYTKKDGGLNPETMAGMLGFESGDALIESLVNLRDRKELIESETDKRMIDDHGDMMLDGSLAERAMDAVHNDRQGDVIRHELKILNRQRGGNRAAPLTAIKASAERQVMDMRVMDLRPDVYLRAYNKAQRRAFDAAASGDLETAYQAKQQQLYNHYLYRASRDAKEVSDKNRDHVAKFKKKSRRERLARAGADYLEQTDAILAEYEFIKVPKSRIARRQSLRDWLVSKHDELQPIAEPEYASQNINAEVAETAEAQYDRRDPDVGSLVAEAETVNWQELTVGQLQGVRDNLDLIWHVATLKDKLLREQDKRRISEVATQLADSINENSNRTIPRVLQPDVGWNRRKDKAAEYLAQSRRIPSFAREMDGGKDGGVVWDTIIRPLNEATSHHTRLIQEHSQAFADLYSKHYSRAEMGDMLKKPKRFDSINASLTKDGVLAMGLNWGNPINRDRLMMGYGWTERQVEQVLDSLDKRDWEFIQGVWDYLETYRADFFENHRKMFGVAPQQVDPTPVQTKYGTFRGGYYPIKFDATQNQRTADRAMKEESRRYSKPTSKDKASASHERLAEGTVSIPIRLNVFGVVNQHVSEVVHHIAFDQTLYDVARILAQPNVQEAMVSHYGRHVYQRFNRLLTDIKFGTKPADGSFEEFVVKARNNMSVAAMAYSTTVSILQPLGMTNSIVQIGPYWVMRGLGELVGGTAQMENVNAWVIERSEFMRYRRLSPNREIGDVMNKIRRKGVRTAMDASAFWAIANTQYWGVDLPTWLGAYRKAQAAGVDEATAALMADQSVRDAQGGGDLIDQTEFQRGGPMVKLFTNFMSYMATTWSIQAERYRATDFNDPAQVMKFVQDHLILMIVPAVGSMLLDALGGRDDPFDDEPEEILARLLGEVASMYTGGFVGFRELSGAMQGYNNYSGPAGAAIFGETSGFISQAMQGDLDEGLFRATLRTSGIFFGLPAYQMDRTIFGTKAMIEGETDDPRAILFGPPKDD